MKVIGIGGTVRPDSSSEAALRTALRPAEEAGNQVAVFAGHDLQLPMYDPSSEYRSPEAKTLVAAVQSADAVVLSSPGYHGAVSGLVKNALDYIEDLREVERPYLDGRVVGCIGVGYGWQGAVAAMQGLRQVVHALRGWPTPYGAVVNTVTPVFDAGRCINPEVEAKLRLVGAQVIGRGRANVG